MPLEQHLSSFSWVQDRVFLESFVGGLDGSVDIVDTVVGARCPGLVGARVDDIETFARLRLNPFAMDVGVLVE
jgi:hypothetical protein